MPSPLILTTFDSRAMHVAHLLSRSYFMKLFVEGLSTRTIPYNRLMFAVRTGDALEVRSILKNYTPAEQVALFNQDKWGYSPILAAARLGLQQVVQALLKDLPFDMRINELTQERFNGLTLLMSAAASLGNRATVDDFFKDVIADD